MDAPLLEPELHAYDRQFSAATHEARQLLDGLTERQLSWRETSDAWSIIDCLNHLVVTGNESLSSMRSAIADARAHGRFAAGPFRHSIAGDLFVRLMDAPPWIKFGAPRAYRPVPGAPVSEILTAFFGLQNELARILREADGLDLARVKVANPVSAWFRLSLGQELAFTAAHERRHLWQARRVREKLSSTRVGP